MADNRPVPLIHFTQNCEWSTKVYNGQWCRILLLTKITKLFLKFSRRIDFELHIEYEHHIRNPLSLDVDKLAEKDGISWVSKCNVPLPFSRDDVDKSEIRTALIHIVVTK